jgi:hypothetical protein
MGYRSQNFYGKNFKDCSIQSKIVNKMASSWFQYKFLILNKSFIQTLNIS